MVKSGTLLTQIRSIRTLMAMVYLCALVHGSGSNLELTLAASISLKRTWRIACLSSVHSIETMARHSSSTDLMRVMSVDSRFAGLLLVLHLSRLVLVVSLMLMVCRLSSEVYLTAWNF